MYLLLSLLFWHTLFEGFSSATLDGGRGDPGLFMSWLQWAAFSVTHGINPFHNGYLQAPFGVSALWNTSVLALGIPLAPVTLLFGASTSYNCILIVSPALTCWTASKWLRRHVGTASAAVGAAFYGFSPFMLAHLAGHIHLTFLALLPVIVMLVEDLLIRSDRPRWPTAPLLGAVIAVQYLIGSEMLLLLALTTVPVVALLAVTHFALVRARWARVVVAGATAVIVAGGLLAYPLFEQFSRSHRIDTAVMTTAGFVAQVRHLFSATSALYFHGSTASVAGLSRAENGVYVGWPLLAVLILTVVVLRRVVLVRVAALVALVAVVCELNPKINGLSLSPLEFLQHRWGLTASILPVRFASVFFLAAALLVAFGLQEALRQVTARPWAGVAGVALVAAAVISHVPGPSPSASALPSAPAFFTDGSLQRHAPDGATVMIAPMADAFDTTAELWQVEANLSFKQLGGYALNNQGNGDASFMPRQKMLTELFGLNRRGQLYSGPVTRAMVETARDELVESSATLFLVGPSPDVQREARTAALVLGRGPDLTSGGVLAWLPTAVCVGDPVRQLLCP